MLDPFVPEKALASAVLGVADTNSPLKSSTADVTLNSAEAVSNVESMLPALCDPASAPGPSTAGMLRKFLVDLFRLEAARARPWRLFVGGCSGKVFGASGVGIAGIFVALSLFLGFIFADSEEMSRVT